MLLDNKTVVLGVTGGIAAYKALELTSKLVKSGAQVKVIMTKSAVEFVAPLSFQSLSGNPVAMAAGLATLTELQKHPEVYQKTETLAAKLAEGLRGLRLGTVNQIGSLLCVFFTDGEVIDYQTAKSSDTARYGRYFHHMLNRGIYLAPAQFEAMFVSAAHTGEDIDAAIKAAASFED